MKRGSLSVLTAILSVLALYPLGAQSSDWNSFGPPGGQVTTLVVDPDDSSTVYAGTWGGPFKSSAGGMAKEGDGWRPASGALRASEVLDVTIHPVNPGILYASTLHCGVFGSVDAGMRWRRLAGPDRPALDLAIDPADPRRLYAATNVGVDVTTDGGSVRARRLRLMCGP